MASSSLTAVLRETLALFAVAGEPWTTSEVADRIDVGRRGTYERLERLVEAGRLETKKVGGNGRVWWRPPAADATSDWSAAAESLITDVLDGAEVGIFVLDEDFEVAWINDTTERYFGLSRESVLGRDKRRLVDERLAPIVDDGEGFSETVLATYDDNSDTERFECRVTGGEGREARWLEHRSEPIEDGAYAGGRVELYYDVTDRKRVERAHDVDRTQFESVIDAVEEYAIFRLDPDGTVQSWNQGAARIKGYAADEILGEHVSTFYTEEDCAAGVPEESLAVAADQGSVQDEAWRLRADGTRFWATITITAVRGADGELEGYVKVTRDMTERRERERELRRERNLLERVQEASPVGIGIFDPDGELRRANRRFGELLGQEDPDALAYSLGDQAPLDADGNVIPYPERPAPKALSTGERVTDRQLRIDGPDGRTRWLSVNANPFDGDAEGVVVTTTDVTRLKIQSRRLERQREALQGELEEMFGRIDNGFFSLDDDLRFTYLNDRASELLDADPSELVGEYIWDVLEAGPEVSRRLDEALDSQESLSFEEYYEPLDAWFENHVYPSETGLSIYFQDVTERRRTEAELRRSKERYQTLFESIDQGFCTVEVLLDEDEPVDYRFLETNPAFEEHTGLVDVEGERMRDLEPDHEDYWFETYGRVARTGDPKRFVDEAEHLGDRWYDVYAFPVGGPAERTVGILFSDVTERKERELELERYEQLVETVWDGVYALDEDDRMVLVNEAFCDLVGYDRAELLGEHPTLLGGDDVNQTADRLESTIISGDRDVGVLELEIQRKDGERVPVETRLGPFEYEDGRVGRCGVTRDITDRKRFEETLIGLYESTQTLFDAAGSRGVDGAVVDAVADVIDMPGVVVYRFDDDADELTPSADSIEGEFMRGGDLPAVSPDDSTLTGHVYASGEIHAFDDITESPYVQSETEMRGGLFVPIGDHRVLVVGTPEAGGIDDNDRRLVELLATNAEAAYQRVEREVTLREHERELEHQRESLAALNNLNEVVHDITDAVIEQSTRQEIEATVCERLADSESYQFAWIGDVDTATQTVNLREEAGVEGYLDGVTISVDPDDDRSDGPTGRALRTGDPQVSHDIRAESRYDPWREHVESYGFRSSAAIPIVHQGTVYGVINVYAEGPYAFNDPERGVISQLGEVVGHAIAATERKQALMSDELVELEFRIQDLFRTLDLPVEPAGTITIDHAVPVGDDEFLVYGSVTPDAVETLRGITESIPHWQDLTIRSADDPASFEVRLTEPPVLSAVASLGGYVDRAVIEDGDYRMRIHLAPSVETRRLNEVVEAAYPTAEMVRRRQLKRARDDPKRFQRHLADDLTDRQRTALETAYHAGFFEWPRDTSGEEVAATIGVASPTFHQHLRKAERKVFDALLSSPIQGVD